MLVYEQLLWSGVGLFNAVDTVSRDVWADYIEALEIDEHWPGIQGMGFSVPVSPQEKANHTARIRSEGFPDYAIKPEGVRAGYSAIIYLEPFDWRNQRAFGYDMWSNAMRREAMARARDTGTASTSGVITLVQETEDDVQRGFLTYVPLYEKGKPTTTVQERRDAFRGWVYSPFRMGDLMEGILGQGRTDVEYQIYDGSVFTAETLLYDSNNLRRQDGSNQPQFERNTMLSLQGREWALSFATGSDHLVGAEKYQSTAIAIGGLIVDVLLFYLITALASLQKQATGAAEEVAELVAVRTEELSKTNKHLEQTILEREQTEEALRVGEARNRALLDAMPDLMLRIHRDGTFLDYQAKDDRALAIPPDQLLGKKVIEAMPLGFAELLLENVDQVLKTGQLQVFEYQMLREEGLHDYEARIVVSGSDETLSIIRDITEHKRIERMKNEFVSVVSHELRTPLTSISGSLGLITCGAAGELAPQAKAMLGIAHRNSERLVRLINDLLDIQKIESGLMTLKRKPVELMRLVEQALEANRGYGEQFEVAFVLGTQKEEVWIEADEDRLLQVMANLLSNAAKFSSPKSIVEISVEAEATSVRVLVQDQGAGIPEEFRDRIFQKFAQADTSSTRQKQGTGLGLSVCKSIIGLHGGQIGFETEMGVGTTFSFALPRGQAGDSETGCGQAVTSDASGQPCVLVGEDETPGVEQRADGQRRILHVEDDQDMAHVVAMSLRALAEVEHASSLSEAKQQLAAYSYDLVILDVGLPDGNGLAVLPHLPRLGDRPVPVVIYSAQEVDYPTGEEIAGILIKTRASPEQLQSLIQDLLNDQQEGPA